MNTASDIPQPDPPPGSEPAARAIPEYVPTFLEIVESRPRVRPNGCGCAFLAVFFWVILFGLFVGFCALAFGVERSRFGYGPSIQVPAWFFEIGLVPVTAGAIYLSWWGERTWRKFEASKGPQQTWLIGCGLMIALPIAVVIFLLTVCG